MYFTTKKHTKQKKEYIWVAESENYYLNNNQKLSYKYQEYTIKFITLFLRLFFSDFYFIF